MAAGKWIYRLGELGQDHNDIVGKKCANLGEMTKAGFRVPEGFALSLKACDRFMKETGALEEMRSYLKTFTADPNKAESIIKFEEASQALRGIVESKAMPEDMRDAIAASYREVCQRTEVTDVPVATRSAGTASHPGQYETFLHVKGEAGVIQNIIKVWSSAFNTRSLINRARGDFPLDDDPIGVAVLQMVNAKSAGVLFTLNPMDGDPSKIVIEGNWGLGESVVSGEIIPDKWVVDKVVFEINDISIAQKHKEYNIDPKTGIPTFLDLPPHKQNAACLNQEEIVALCKIGKDIEKHFGIPQDIEWAVDEELPFPENIFMLQCRSEQVWGGKKSESKLKLGTGGFGSVVSSFMKKSASTLNGKKVLVVDDEKDVLDSLSELLNMCDVETASSFEQAKELLEGRSYDIAILDIMGVNGYALLEIANDKKIPALMFTAHALSEEHLKESAKKGAAYYVPKEEMGEIEVFVADVLDAGKRGLSPWERWFDRLGAFFDKKFGGKEWRDRKGDFFRKEA